MATMRFHGVVLTRSVTALIGLFIGVDLAAESNIA
jgi:hypothetical protein